MPDNGDYAGPARFHAGVDRPGWLLQDIIGQRLNSPDLAEDSHKLLLGRLLYRFRLSPLAIRLLARLMDDRITLQAGLDAHTAPAWFDPGTRSLHLDLDHEAEAGFAMMREARLARIGMLGLSSALDGYQAGLPILAEPVMMLAIHRMLQADSDCHALVIARQMAVQGDASLWGLCHDLQDLQPIVRVLDTYPHLMQTNTSRIIRDCMATWFATVRLAQSDHYMLEWLEWLADHHAPVTWMESGRVVELLINFSHDDTIDDHDVMMMWQHARSGLTDKSAMPVGDAERLMLVTDRLLRQPAEP